MEMAVATAVLLAMGWVLGWVLWWWNDIWYNFRVKGCGSGNTRLPPGYMGIPVVGDMLRFFWYFKIIRRPDEYIKSKRRKYGNGVGMYKSYLFGTPCIISCTPSSNKFVFGSEETFLPEWPNADIVGETSLVSVQGPAHARVRTFVTKIINQPDALRRIALMVQPRMIAALQSWADKGRINAYYQVKKVTFENIGKYFGSFEPGPVLDSLDISLTGILKGMRAVRVNIPGTAYHNALECRKKAMGIFREELEKRKRKEGGRNGSEPNNNDLLDGLMQLKDDEGKQLSETEVLDNIVSLLTAGYESTSLASMWAIYYLAKYPKVLHKLQEETLALRKIKKDDELVTSDEIVSLKYLRKVVEETIRMANVAAFVFRTVAKDAEYRGCKIPKGWRVLIWLRYLHTDPENFEDPMCFNPDRWDAIVRPQAYQVFGVGSRMCVGNMLARLQVSILLYYLTTGYKWELVNPDAEIAYLPHPKPVDGVEINIKYRNSKLVT